MFHAAEVVETNKAYKSGQKDDNGIPLFNGSILVRIGGSDTALGQVKNLWCAPATFNKRIPLIGEQILVFEAQGTEQSSTTFKTKRYYYFVPYNTVNDVSLHHFPTQWGREGGGSASKPTGQVLADKKEVGYTIDKRARGVSMLQPFEGDDIWEGRFGQSIRFTRSYKSVNGAGTGIYQKDGTKYYPSKRAYDPMIIMKVKKPKQGSAYDIEDIGTDASSIYLTTSQKLLKFQAGPPKARADRATMCEIKDIPQWDKGAQIIIDSDRVVINAKNDIAFLLSRNKSIISGGKGIVLRTNKYHVEVDDLMKWLKALASELNKLATAQATFTTFMGPTGVASNSAQITKIAKTDFKQYFEKGGCSTGPANVGAGSGDSTKGKPAANALAGPTALSVVGGLLGAVGAVFGGGSGTGGAGGGGGGGAGGSGGGGGGGGGAAPNAGIVIPGAQGGSGIGGGVIGAGMPTAGNTAADKKGFVDVNTYGLPTRNNKDLKSPINATLAARLKTSMAEMASTGCGVVITDTNDTKIHKSKAQNSGRSVDVNFAKYNATPDCIANAISAGEKNGLALVWEVDSEEKRQKLLAAKPELKGKVAVVGHITAAHFSVYMQEDRKPPTKPKPKTKTKGKR